MSLTTILIHMCIALAIIMLLIMKLHVNAALSLFLGAIYVGALCQVGLSTTVTTFASGFGGTMTSLGLSVGIGVILGQLMADCGAAYIIAHKMIGWFPKGFALIALILVSTFLAIPVFYDVVLVIMTPIGLAMAKELKAPRSIICACICLGAGCGHSYIPPTPGPLAAAEAYGISLGTMIVVGLIISLVTVVFTYPIIKWLCWPKNGKSKFFNEETDQDPDFTPMVAEDYSDKKLPAFGLSLLPVLVPVVLILVNAFMGAYSESVPDLIVFLGNKNTALLIGTLIAYILARTNMSASQIEKSASKALQACGVVLLITGTGAAFGSVIKATGVTDMLQEVLTGGEGAALKILLITFFVGVILRICMGSASSAGITTATIMAPVVAGITTVHPVWFAIAGLAGCAMIGLPNDSGFWVSGNLYGFNLMGNFKTYTILGGIRSIVILVVCIIGMFICPLV